MFYQTVLKSVGQGGAVDAQGKRLSFIGYMQAQAGDTVWTDGNIIFGNVPPKDTPKLALPPKGIPIMDDQYFGKVNKTGSLIARNNAIDAWIVNDKKNFEYGSNSLGNQKVIEADIFETSEEKNLHIVTDGFYKLNQFVKFNNHMFMRRHYLIGSEEEGVIFGTDAYSVNASLTPLVGEEITLGVESPSLNQTAKIYRNNELIQEISLQKYADFIVGKSWEVESEIMAKSDNSGVNYYKQPAPPQSFIASTYARIISFRINKSADWDAIIFASAYGYCFPYVTLLGSVLESTFNSETGAKKTFSAELATCTSNIESSIFTANNFPFLEIEKYPKFTGSKKENGEYTAEYMRYIEKKIDYYIPRVRFKFSQWFTVNFGASCLLRVHNDEIVSVMQLRKNGGADVLIPIEWTEQWQQKDFYYSQFKVPAQVTETAWTFPLSENFYCEGYGNNFRAIYNGDEKVFDLTQLDLNIGIYFEVDNARYRNTHIDALAATHAAALKVSINSIWFKTIQTIACSYTVTNKYGKTYNNWFARETAENFFTEYFPNLQNKADYFLLDGYFDYFADDGFFRFNPSVGKLSDSTFVFGVHDGELFTVTNSDNEKIADKLKNFRLHEMKNLNNAKIISQ